MNPTLRARFDEAVKLKERGQLESARKILQELARQDSQSPAILSVLGHVCWKSGQLHKSAAAFRKATVLAPKLEAASLGLFHVLLENHKPEEALKEAERFMLTSESQTYCEIINKNYERLITKGPRRSRAKGVPRYRH